MRRFKGLVLGTAVCLLATAAAFAQGPGSVQLWQLTILNNDRGVMFLTFSNNVSVTDTIDGYGISIGAHGPFTVNGTWGFDTKGNITGGYTRFFEDLTSEGTQLRAKLVNGRFLGRTKAPGDRQVLKAPSPAAVPDISGAWVAKGRTNGQKILTTFTLAASTNLPGWFDLNGSGMGNSGTFDLTGAILITSDHNIGAFTASDTGTATTQAAFAGKLSHNGKNLTIVGQDDNNNNVIIHAKKSIVK